MRSPQDAGSPRVARWSRLASLRRSRPPSDGLLMDLAEALRRRRMVRHYTGAAVAPDALDRIVAAGLSAPTAGGAQGTAIVTVTAPERIAAIAAACGEPDWTSRGFDPWLSTAGAHLVLCVEPEIYRERYLHPAKQPAVLEAVPWWWVDGGAAL